MNQKTHCFYRIPKYSTICGTVGQFFSRLSSELPMAHILQTYQRSIILISWPSDFTIASCVVTRWMLLRDRLQSNRFFTWWNEVTHKCFSGGKIQLSIHIEYLLHINIFQYVQTKYNAKSTSPYLDTQSAYAPVPLTLEAMWQRASCRGRDSVLNWLWFKMSYFPKFMKA